MNIWDMFSLKGKAAVVTGGSGMYGRQIVLALAQAGARVYTASRSSKTNEKYASELRADGLDVAAATVDQGDEKSILNFSQYVLAKEKKIDILVNNAVARVTKDGWHCSLDDFSESMRINATGVFAMSRAFGEHMAEGGGGSIINIGSYMGTLGPDYWLYDGTGVTGGAPDYFFHKGGMVTLTRYIASYYGPKNIRCNVLCLGGLYSQQDERFVKRYSERTFLKRMANDTDIMGAVVYLASDASCYLTGAIIPIDGGYSAK